MSKPRFTVAWRRGRGGGLWCSAPGWAVYDRARPITITFANFCEALEHRDKIAALYLRFGW